MAVVKAELWLVRWRWPGRPVRWGHWFGVSTQRKVCLAKVGSDHLVFGPLQTSQVGPVVKYGGFPVCLEEAVQAYQEAVNRINRQSPCENRYGDGYLGCLAGQAVDCPKIRELPS